MKIKFSPTVHLDDKLLKKIKIYCIDKNINMKEFVTRAIIEKAISVKILDEE